MAKTLSVAAIKEGTVIDHIPAGTALTLLQLLHLLDEGYQIAIGLRLKSPSMGQKDLIKIETRIFTPEESKNIALFAPCATINQITNYQVIQKIQPTLPETIAEILRCPNPSCITQCDNIRTLFQVQEHKRGIVLKCHYCEKCFHRDELNVNIFNPIRRQ